MSGAPTHRLGAAGWLRANLFSTPGNSVLTVLMLALPAGALADILKRRSILLVVEAGLVATQKDGRVRSCAFQAEALRPMTDWLDDQRKVWEARLDRLDDYGRNLMKAREK